MSDKELIEEARRQVGHIENKSMRERLISDLADAIEAATRVPVQGEPNNDRESLKRIAEEASVQRLKDSIEEWRKAIGAAYGTFPDDWELEFWHAGYKHGANAMIEHQLSHATVPDAEAELAAIKARAEEVGQDEGWHIGGAWGDYGEVVVPLRILSYVVDGALDEKIVSTDPGYAATYAEQVARADHAEAERDDLEERLAGYLCDSTGGLLSKTGYDVRTMVTHTEDYYDKVHAEARKEAEAERDAAVAAIERCRAVAMQHRSIEQHNEMVPVSDIADLIREPSSADYLAALDEAPEPETAPENYEPKCNGACVVHGSPVTNWPVQYGRRNRETGALHWLKGDPFDSWWDENQDRYEHVKRYTSPPLPVEGESKP